MSRRKDKEVAEAYKNLEKLGPWGEQSIIYSLFTTDEGFKKTDSKQFKSAQVSPRKTFSKQIMPQTIHHTGQASPLRVFTGRPAQRGTKHELPRTNVQEYFNKKPDKKMNTISKKLYPIKSIAKSLPLLNVKKQLEIERKVFVMMNRKIEQKIKTQYGSFKTVENRERRNTMGEPVYAQSQRLPQKTGFKRQFQKMLKIIDTISQEDPLWISRKIPN